MYLISSIYVVHHVHKIENSTPLENLVIYIFHTMVCPNNLIAKRALRQLSQSDICEARSSCVSQN